MGKGRKLQKIFLGMVILCLFMALTGGTALAAQSGSVTGVLKYGKNKFTLTIPAGENGRYSFSFTPQFSGNYNFVADTGNFYYNDSLTDESNNEIEKDYYYYYYEDNGYALKANKTYIYTLYIYNDDEDESYWDEEIDDWVEIPLEPKQVTAQITVSKTFTASLAQGGQTLALAKGKTKTLGYQDSKLVNNKDVTWTSSKPSVATVDKNGKVTAKKEGKTTITVKGKDKLGDSFSDKVTFVVTDPKLSAKSLGLNIYGGYKHGNHYDVYPNSITLKGLSEYSSVTVSSSKNLEYEPEIWGQQGELYFYPKKTGTYKVTVTADGKKLTLTVYVQKLYFSRDGKTVGDGLKTKKWDEGTSTIVLYKGESTTLKLKGVPSKSKVSYSSNKSVATVSKSGKVTAKGVGYTTVKAKVNGVTVSYKVSVTSKNAAKALRYAVKHFGSKYSQAKRMQKGYYDCSSFVWFSYKSAGVYLESKTYAPTAANLAKWCVQKNYMMYYSNAVPTDKLLPGDLVFTCQTKSNNRYNNIYHVDLVQEKGRLITVNDQWYVNSGTKYMVARPGGTKGGGLKATKSGTKKIKLSWSKTYGASGYQLYRSTKKNSGFKKIKTQSGTSYTNTVSKGKTYYYKVRPYWKASGRTYYGLFSSVVKKKI